MFDPENSDGRKRTGSLLAMSSAARDERAALRPASLLAVADTVADDAVSRHRRAREKREAELRAANDSPAGAELQLAPEPVAAEKPAPVAANEDKPSSWSLSGLMPAWLSGRSDTAADRSPPAPVAVAAASASPAAASGFAPAAAAVAPVSGEPAQAAVPPQWPGLDEPRFGAPGAEPEGAPDLYWKPLIDPMAVFSGIAHSKLLVVTTTILGALIGIAIAVSTPKKFEASAELLADPRDLKIVEGELTEGGLPSDATLAIIENQVRVLTSGTVLNRVVDKLNLESDPEFNGEADRGMGIAEVISMLRSIISRQDGPGEGDIRRALAVGNLAKSLTVSRGGKTFVIVISALTEDAEKSALIANTMTDVFLETYGEIQSQAAGRAEGEITARLDQLRDGVEEAERKVEAFKAEHELIDTQGRLITDDEIVSLNGQLSLARARTLELNAKAASARGVDVDSVLGGALPEQVASSVLTELRGQYANLRQEADRQAIRLGPRHPERQALDAQLAGLREQIATELRRSVSSIQVELKRAVQLEQELAARLAQLKIRQGDVNDEMVTLRELEREAAARRSVYEGLLKRARETGEQKVVNSANMSVISTAYPPLDPTGPSRATISLTGMMLGFFAGIAMGGLRGAYQGLRQNIGVPQQRRRWRRWRTADERATVLRLGPEPEAMAPLAEDGDSRAEELVRRVAAAAPAEKSPAAPDPALADPASPPEAAEAAQPMDAPMTDPYASQYAPPSPQAPYPQPAAYPQPPAYAQPPAYPMPQQALYPQQAGYQSPYPAQPYQGQPYPYPPAPYGYPQPFQHWQPQPAPVPYYPQQAGAQQPAPSAVPQVAAAAEAARQEKQRSENQSQIDEIRESLREFREAVRDFTESRSRRKFF